MKLTVKYSLSETGRKASLKAGGNGAEQQLLVLDAPIEALDWPWIDVLPDGSVELVGDSASPSNSRYAAKRGLCLLDAPLGTLGDVTQRTTAAVAAYEATERANAELRAKNAAAEVEMERLAAVKEAAIQAQVEAWVAEHGTDSQKARLNDGLLPRQEVLDALKAGVFTALEEASTITLGAYEGVTQAILHDGELSAAQYATYMAVKKAVADIKLDATYELRTCGADDCDASLDRDVLMVVVKIGELRFTREYAL